MNNYITYILLLILLFSCRKVDEVYPFENGKKIKLFMNYPQDKNGYFHVTIDSTAVNNRCNLYLEVSDLVPYYRYNGVSVIEASFDTDTYWVLGTVVGDVILRLPLYNPFSGVYTNKNFDKPVYIGDTSIVLNQFKNSIIPIVQSSGIYLKEYDPGSMYKPADEYKPENGMLWGKKIIGPIPGKYIGDTATIYVDIFWDASNWSVTHPQQTKEKKEINIIFTN